MESMDWLDTRKCATCGRKFTVLRPHMWAYKRGTTGHMKYYCSWSCLRKSEGKDETEMGRPRKDGTPAKAPVRKAKVEVADRLPEAEKEWTPAEEVYPKEEKKPSFAEMKKQIPDDAKILGQEPLEVASVFSRVVKDSEYRRESGGKMTLIMPITNNLRMTAYEWFKFSEEILVAIRQLDMANPSRALEPEEYTGNNAPLKG